MRHFGTRDPVTNANLRYLESAMWLRPNMSADEVTGHFRTVIVVEKMLPAEIQAKFELPFLFIGASAEYWSVQERKAHVEELVAAVLAGLDAIIADPSLGKEGDADLTDRPFSKGEELRAAVEAIRKFRGQREISNLRLAISGTTLQRYMDRLDSWLARKRPSPGGQSLEYEIISAIGDIDRRTSDWHHVPASQDFDPHRNGD